MDGVPDLYFRGLDDQEARELLGSVVGGPLGPLLADRIVSETRGNPLALVELGGELTSDHLAGAPITEPLPVNELVEARFLRQVRALPHDTQMLLLVAAADGVGEPAAVLRASTLWTFLLMRSLQPKRQVSSQRNQWSSSVIR